VKYPHEKYNSANYEMLARIMYQFSGDGLADVQQFARRLLVNNDFVNPGLAVRLK
jgi:serine/threonine-protein kinase HipA